MKLQQAPWRRALAGIGFVGAIALLASQTCRSELASTTIRFDLGAPSAAELRSLRADLFRGDDPELIGYYERSFGDKGGAAVVGPWTLRADEGTYRLVIEIRSTGGARTAERTLHIEDGASVTIDLTDLTGDR